ncbi:ribose 1,5-bisphosphokinase [Bradyrhizobium sp. STM 3843]|uniref:phosphonate metabolism protein/1,5-bisphosphokinase (PRPP-forming) PhnN n=1 Tax=Bradyrhizobium sp. STM 3843 TaxID=551947 RepID=UPI000240349F|nr:phosphonate metabolism protein/1,5-bisphosphokinase (PRPP-forming) PhnN [Bradyrhizobium sp. STM 3843]CCE11355.1 ribose 1,5-bisphosphokinase [Bradyrhizobium sp. STM 3843]
MSETSAPSTDMPLKLGPGRIVLVVGPSGAGKDTLINLARAECAGDDRVVFPRRVVTRRASTSEDNDELDETAFRLALARDQFAIHWEAHGHLYGLRRDIDGDIRAGRTVVVNVSRRVIAAFRRAYAHVVVVAVTAPSDVLAERLAQRHRPSDGDLDARLHRAVSEDPFLADLTICNVGDAKRHASTLLGMITREFGGAGPN